MQFTVLTLFPELFAPFWDHGIIRRAIEGEIIKARAVNVRDYAEGRHKVTDDRPYGGGCGMVMKPEPLAAAIRAAKARCPAAETVLLSPQGRVFDQPLAVSLARGEGLILVCGRYEGIDERVAALVDSEISIGDYVLTGGEVAAMVVVDAVTRLLPGALGGADSADNDSFAADRLEHAQYTRPPVFEDQPVPEVLLSGDHAAIARWRRQSALIRTLLKRPDLLRRRRLDAEEARILERWCTEVQALVTTEDLPGAGPLSSNEPGR